MVCVLRHGCRCAALTRVFEVGLRAIGAKRAIIQRPKGQADMSQMLGVWLASHLSPPRR